jgi:PAS domain S-box-containing protein
MGSPAPHIETQKTIPVAPPIETIDSSDILNSKILIVDDQEANVRDLKRMLAAAGYVFVASSMNLHEACELHRKNRYNLILLDLHMPNLDGFELMKCIRDIEPEGYLPILVITAEPAHRLRALQAGAKDFISKPFDPAELLMRTHNLLEVCLLQTEAKNYGEFLEQMVDERAAGLRENEVLFRQAVEACPSGMIMVDHTGKMVMANTEIERQFGYRREDLIGQPVEMLIPVSMRVPHVRHCANFTAVPETRRIGACRDLFGLRKDGTEFPIEVGLNPIETQDGLLVLSVIVDISERKRIERLKDEFVATVSHELRTPLTSIAGSLGLLIGGSAGKLPEPAERLLMIAQKNSQRLVRLLNDILDIEKIEFGKVAFDLERIVVRPLIEQAIESIRGLADGIPIRLESGNASAEVYADSYRLLQVFTNLLSNAIKFSPAGQEVVVEIEKVADAVRISVRDHGHGIPQEFKSHVFEKFAQADASDARQKGGTGLGLSIVKEIVTRLGGEVSFEDAPGEGTIFRVALPAWKPAEPDAPSRDHPLAAPAMLPA